MRGAEDRPRSKLTSELNGPEPIQKGGKGPTELNCMKGSVPIRVTRNHSFFCRLASYLLSTESVVHKSCCFKKAEASPRKHV